ncbi:MAG TPA: hypothetical protein EYH56_01905 [Nanoarchaeota archaeon]|nr:hypothetical protein [Nanoarchaeota archaeon]
MLMVIDYEERMKKWRIIYIIFIALMIFVFFTIFSNAFEIIKQNTPFILENCKWYEKEIISSGLEISSHKLALEEAKKYVKGNYSNISITEEFEKCIGWLVEFKNNFTVVEKIFVCKNGWIYIYEKKCEKKSFMEDIIELFKTKKGE